jgi:uncharacterized protein DUF6551
MNTEPSPPPPKRRPRSEKTRGFRGNDLDKKDKYKWVTVDESGVLYEASKQELKIDDTYQRSMCSESRIASIAQAWSWLACGTIIVAEREDKTLWVIDGQHRVLAAMRRSDIQDLPCLVFKSDSPESEARAFFRANCIRGNVSPYDKLRALLVSKDQTAIDAVDLMNAQGYRPSTGDHPHCLRCISAFLTAMKTSRHVLERVWPMIAKLHDGLAIRKTVFAAFIYLGKYGSEDIASEEWQRRVLKAGLHNIANGIDRACSAYVKGGTKVYAQAVLEIINKGVRTHRMQINESPDDDEDYSQ